MSLRKNKKEPQEPKESLKEKIAANIGLDREIALNLVHIEMTGNRELFIENYKGIIEYTDTVIRINTNPSPLRIEGKGLEVKSITREMLYVTGYFKEISFLKNS